MMLLDRITAVFAPHHCHSCGKEGLLLCSDCRYALPPHPMLCIRCHSLSPGYRTCAKCRPHQTVSRVFIAGLYENSLKTVIGRLKYHRAIAAVAALAPLLSEILPPEKWDAIVPVPSTSSRHRARGYNPAALLSRQLTLVSGAPHLPVLRRIGQARQVGAKRAERLTQLTGSFYTTTSLEGMRILLVDDVVTTGATIHECARTLRDSGAQSVDAVVLARHTT
jgi:competence protein ComFC